MLNTTSTGVASDMIMGGASSSSSSYSGFPDYIGVESCVHMRTEADQVVDSMADKEEEENDSRVLRRRRHQDDDRERKKEYPPLIPLLAQTENLHSHMPWVLMRHYTPDGRLVLTEEKVKHHEYFRAHRHNGRLTLQLITLDHEVSSYGHSGRQCEDEHDVIEDVFEAQASLGMSPSSAEEGGENSGRQANGQEEEEEEEEGEGEGLMKGEKGIGCGGGSKCLSYNSVGVVGSPSSPSAAGSCLLGMMPVPALRQIHS